MKAPASPASRRRSRNAFPALSAFFVGYLHEDFEAEHGSVRRAFQAFEKDAHADDVARARQEWERFEKRVAELPHDELVRQLQELGCAFTPRGVAELSRLFGSLDRGARAR